MNGNPTVTSALDALGKTRLNDTKFAWNSIFGAVVGFVKSEIESIAKLADKVVY